MRSFTRAEFLANPSLVMRVAEESGEPVVILRDDGEASAIISCPRDERPLPLAEPSLTADEATAAMNERDEQLDRKYRAGSERDVRG